MENKTFDHSGLTFNYYQTGSGSRDVFLQHGYSDNALCWGNLPADLGKDYRVTLMDARGHGLSAKPKDGYDLDHMAGDVIALFDHLGMQKPFYVGHSMGGSIGARVAALAPDRLRAAVLIDPVFLTTAKEEREGLVAKRRNEVRDLQKKSKEEIAAHIRNKHPDWPEEFICPAADAKLQMSLDMIAINRTVIDTWAQDLENSTCPILVITADVERGAIVSREVAAEIDKKHSHVSTAHIPEAGHSIQREKYAQTLAAIRGFFSNH